MWKWLQEKWSAAKHALVSTWQHVQPVLEADAEELAEVLFQIAVAAVTRQIPLVLSGSVKFDNAVQSVIADAESQLIAVAKPMAQKAVQDAYVAMLAANGGVLAAKIPDDPAKAAEVKEAVAAAGVPIDKPPADLPTS